MKWADLQQEFVRDGALRDIYVLDVGIAGWRSLWRLLKRTAVWRVTYEVDGTSAPLPHDVEVPLELRSRSSILLSVFLGKIQLNCHFSDDSDIEFDLDPRDVEGQADLDEVLTFIREMGRATLAQVILTPESMPGFPMIRYDVGTDSFARVPPSDWPR